MPKPSDYRAIPSFYSDPTEKDDTEYIHIWNGSADYMRYDGDLRQTGTIALTITTKGNDFHAALAKLEALAAERGQDIRIRSLVLYGTADASA